MLVPYSERYIEKKQTELETENKLEGRKTSTFYYFFLNNLVEHRPFEYFLVNRILREFHISIYESAHHT